MCASLAGSAGLLGNVAALAQPTPVPTTGPEIQASVVTSHPRLLVTDLEALRAKCSTGVMREWTEQLLATADGLLGVPAGPQPPLRSGDWTPGMQLVGGRIETLTTASVLASVASRDPQPYLARLLAEMDHVAGWNSWVKDPAHPDFQFIDTADFAAIFSLAYDWCHAQLDEARRTRYRTALQDRFLAPAAWQVERKVDWVQPGKTYNWVPVCRNGLVLASLTLMHEGGDDAALAEWIRSSIEPIRVSMSTMAPDGGWFEGPHYWWYGTRAMVETIEALQSATGSHFGLADLPGVRNSGWFTIDLTGPTGATFNWGDAQPEPMHGSQSLALARRFGEVGWADWRAVEAGGRPQQLDFAYTDPAQLLPQPSTRWHWRANQAIYRSVHNVTARSGWDDLALFVGLKGGRNDWTHGHLDLGDIVLDGVGHRWAEQLGTDNYGGPGYWDAAEGGMRSTYYRCRAEGNNTLSLPADFGGQLVAGTGEIERSGVTPERFFSIIRTSGASAGLTSWRRGIDVTDFRRQVVLRDEFTCRGTQDVWWTVHTATRIELSSDRRRAMLHQGSERCLVELLGGDEVFTVLPAVALWSSPLQGAAKPLPPVQRLAIRYRQTTGAQPTVRFVPLAAHEDAPAAPPAAALDDWAVGPVAAQLKKLMIDGIPVEGFSSRNFTYRLVGSGAVGLIKGVPADPHGVATVALSSRQYPAVATVTVKTPGKPDGVFRIVFTTDPSLQPGVPVATNVPLTRNADGTWNRAENAIDGNLATRWASSTPGQWIRFDLGEVATVDRVVMSWFHTPGTASHSKFDLEVSDGGPWRTVVAGGLSDGTSPSQTITFAATPARFVRYIARGRVTNLDGTGATSTWNSLNEFSVPGHGLVTAAPIVPTLDRVNATIPGQLAPGQSLTMTVGAVLDDGSALALPQPGTSVEWWTSDPAVVQVSGEGRLTALAEGKAEVAVIVEHQGYLRWQRANIEVGQPGDRTITAIADSYVQSGTASAARHGGETLALIKGGTGAYLKQAVVGFGFVAGTVSSAVLQVSTGKPEADIARVRVRALSADWAEASVCGDTLPTVGAELDSYTLDGSGKKLCEVDVTAQVQACVRDGLGVAFLLEEVVPAGVAPHNIDISTRESGATLAPKLVVKA